jgi:hypothetical protein
VFADGAFAGRLVDWAARTLRTTLHIVAKPKGQKGFKLIPRRWPVERTFAWLTAHRRLARDYERSPTTSEAIIRWAAINQMIRRLTRGHPAQRQQRWRWPDTLVSRRSRRARGGPIPPLILSLILWGTGAVREPFVPAAIVGTVDVGDGSPDDLWRVRGRAV